MTAFDKDLLRHLDELGAAGLRRRLRVTGFDDPESANTKILVDGKPCLAFCSNDYLGLAGHPRLTEAFHAAADKYGVGSGAAHLITGHRVEHEALERELAEFTGRPRALLFSTGYAANLGVAQALLGRRDLMVEDRLNHASLIDAAGISGARLKRYRHADTGALATRLGNRSDGRVLVATDGVFSMDGDVAPLPGLVRETKAAGAMLMVDDAHGIGVLGATGRGTPELFDLGNDDVPVYMATLGKALGTFGAFVAGSEALIDTLVQKARTYVYTTAPPPAIAAATRTALRLVDEEPWRRDDLRDRIAYFKKGAATLGLPLAESDTAIQPLLLGKSRSAMAAAAGLLNAGVMVTAIRPPTVPEGTARLRIALSAAHSRAHIDRLLDALENLGLDGIAA